VIRFLQGLAWCVGFVLAVAALGFFVRAALAAVRFVRVVCTPPRRTAEAAALSNDAEAGGVAVEVYGKVHLGADGGAYRAGAAELVTSPLTRTLCLAYRLEVTGRDAGAAEQQIVDTLLSLRDAATIFVDDGSGPVEVDLRQGALQANWTTACYDVDRPFGAIEAGVATQPTVQAEHFELEFATVADDTRDWEGGIDSLSFVEEVLEPADQLFVCGVAEQGALRAGTLQGMIVHSGSPRTARREGGRAVVFESLATAVSAGLAWLLFALGS